LLRHFCRASLSFILTLPRGIDRFPHILQDILKIQKCSHSQSWAKNFVAEPNFSRTERPALC
jgi:hypothetical protein